MTSFTYTAIPMRAAPGAAPISGRSDASDEETLRARLREQGLIAIEVKPARAAASIRLRLRRGVIRRRDSVWFFRTLRRLLSSNVPIEQAMSTMCELAPTDASRRACEATLESLRSGDSLADGVGANDGLAAPQHLALLRVGHESGQLRHCVELIERSIESSEHVRRTVVNRLIYPAILVIASIGAVWILATFVIPRFAETLESAGAQLPLPTRVTLAASTWLVWIVPPVIALAGLALTLRPSSLPPSWRSALDRVMLRLPIVRDLVRLSQAGVLTDTLATMLEGGGDLLAGLEQAESALTSPSIRSRVTAARQAVREGEEPGAALHAQGVLPPEADALVRIGSRSGDLVGSLRQASKLCIEQQEATTDRLLTVMGPAIILLLALLVGWIVYSLISGMLSINDLSAL